MRIKKSLTPMRGAHKKLSLTLAKARRITETWYVVARPIRGEADAPLRALAVVARNAGTPSVLATGLDFTPIGDHELTEVLRRAMIREDVVPMRPAALVFSSDFDRTPIKALLDSLQIQHTTGDVAEADGDWIDEALALEFQVDQMPTDLMGLRGLTKPILVAADAFVAAEPWMDLSPLDALRLEVAGQAAWTGVEYIPEEGFLMAWVTRDLAHVEALRTPVAADEGAPEDFVAYVSIFSPPRGMEQMVLGAYARNGYRPADMVPVFGEQRGNDVVQGALSNDDERLMLYAFEALTSLSAERMELAPDELPGPWSLTSRDGTEVRVVPEWDDTEFEDAEESDEADNT